MGLAGTEREEVVHNRRDRADKDVCRPSRPCHRRVAEDVGVDVHLTEAEMNAGK